MAASPCAIVISVPAAILSALSAAARGGVLFKGGGALEGLAEVRTFAFDKTGTLTLGQPQLVQVEAVAPLSRLEAQAMAALSAWGWQPDYVAVRRQRDLLAASNDDLARGEPLVCLSAARLGKTRLIDNLEI